MSTLTEKKQLLSFHGDASIKEKHLQRLHQHRLADEIVQGIGFKKGKGCAIGCTLNNYDHKAYETELGVPVILAKMEDRIFEGLTVEDSKDFPINFLSAIPIGKDLSNVYKHFFIWMLVDPEDGVIRFANSEQTENAIVSVATILKYSLEAEVTEEQWDEVRELVVGSINVATVDAYAATAAYASIGGVNVAAIDAAVDAVGSHAYAARKKHYKKMADKLIQILSEQ